MSLLDGLKRDARFVGLCHKNKFGKQAIPTLLDYLKQRRRLSRAAASSVIRIVTNEYALTPELEADLSWHFVYTDNWLRSKIAYILEHTSRI